MSAGKTQVRRIGLHDLPDLLGLYWHLHPDDSALPLTSEIEKLWQRICSDPHLHYVGADVGGRLVSTCTLAIIPNLTRSARRRKDSATLRFYEEAGFQAGVKTGFIATPLTAWSDEGARRG